MENRTFSKPKSSSQKRKKRGSSQKREHSSKRRHSSEKMRVVMLLQEEVGNSDPRTVTMLPIEMPYLLNEERQFIKNVTQTLSILSKEESQLSLLSIKAVARIKSLNRI